MEGHARTALGIFVRRLQDLVHAFGPQSALDQVADGDGANEGAEPSILALLLSDVLGEDLGRIVVRLCDISD
jgi:hypothetical protein